MIRQLGVLSIFYILSFFNTGYSTPRTLTDQQQAYISEAWKEDRLDVHVEVLSKEPPRYFGFGFYSMEYSKEELASVMLDFENYADIFRYVHTFKAITEPEERISQLGTWFGEGRAAFARLCAVGDIDSIIYLDSSELQLFVSLNKDSLLHEVWMHDLEGWLNVTVEDLHLSGYIRAQGSNRCRIGIIADVTTAASVPRWLMHLAIRIVLPRIIKDAEDEIERRKNGGL